MMDTRLLKASNFLTTTISHAGFEFDYLDDFWTLNRNVKVNVQFLDDFDKALAERIRETLVYFAENSSANHTSNLTKQLKFYLQKSNHSSFTEEGFLRVKATTSKQNEFRLSVVRGFIRQMRYLGLSDLIDESVFKLTDQWKLSGNEKGVAVLSLDPETGPFSPTEFEAIGHKAAHCFAEGKLSTEEYALLLLFKSTGRRPEQIASLKVKDFELSAKYTGSPTYVVNVPRGKQRSSGFRAQFHPVGLVDYVGKIIEEHIKNQISLIKKIVGRKFLDNEVNEFPLFFTKKSIEPLVDIKEPETMAFLSSELPHIRSPEISRLLIDAVDTLKVTSERTGSLIHVNPYRFRYTLGTRAAIEGAGVLTIAKLLDQSDTQNVDVYVRNVPEYAVEISKIMNQPLARYAAAFTGKLVRDEDEANMENEGAARIPLREKACDVGSCGSNAFCQDYAPIACYLCPKFRPWVNAPHHLVLEWLMEERERSKMTTNNDLAIVTINDRAIVAVCQVIKLCEEAIHG